MSRGNLTWLAVCGVVLLILYVCITWQEQDLGLKRFMAAGSLQVPLVAMRTAYSADLPQLRVLLIHGLSASKSPMLHLGSQLARFGVACFVMDLPGHGDSPAAFSRASAAAAVDAVVAEILHDSTSDVRLDGKTKPVPQLVLIGHSFGAGLAIDAGQRNRQIAGVVALSPAAEPVTWESPGRLLVLLGEFDFPFVRRGAAFLFEQATGTRVPPLEEPGSWEDREGNRRLVVLPWADHAQPLFRAESIQEIKAFLSKLDPGMNQREFSPWAFRARGQLRTLWTAALLLTWFPLFILVSGLFRGRTHPALSAEAAEWAGRAWSPLWIYGAAAGLATLSLRFANPWERLGLMGGGYLSGFFCIIGLAGLAVCRPSFRVNGPVWQALLCSLLGWAILTALCAPVATSHFAHLTLTPGRVWRFPWILLSVFPFYLLDEHICSCRLQGLGGLRLTLFHLSTRLILLIALLVGFFVLKSGQFLLALILPGLLLMSILCWCLARWVARHTRSAMASALFSALATAWFISAFFAQL